jgi:hypothetical protein
MELEGETQVEGPWVGQVVALDDVRADIAMMRTPDGHGRVELTRFHTPLAVRAESENAPANALGIRRIMFTVEGIDDVVAACAATVASSSARSRSTRTSTGSASCVARRASSSGWPSSSPDDPTVVEGCSCRTGERLPTGWRRVRCNTSGATSSSSGTSQTPKLSNPLLVCARRSSERLARWRLPVLVQPSTVA